MQGDRGYDSQPHREALHRRGIKTQLAKRRTEHGSGLGRTRWVVERTLAWLHQFRRLNMRYERRACIHDAFLMLACSLICWNFLKPVIYFEMPLLGSALILSSARGYSWPRGIAP